MYYCPFSYLNVASNFLLEGMRLNVTSLLELISCTILFTTFFNMNSSQAKLYIAYIVSCLSTIDFIVEVVTGHYFTLYY